jgi:peptide/nickel transport system substrate-binding protein
MTMRKLSYFIAVGVLTFATTAAAQKPGGTLRIPHADSPASMSILEESTISTEAPMMAVLNNLVMFDQHVAQNTLDSIIPDLALSWSWDEAKIALTFKLREGVKWHDGKPFSSADVKCTFDLFMGTGTDKLRVNPRKAWWGNLDKVVANGDYEITFQLKRPQPSFIALLASGWSPIYPCHVPARDMRLHPVGTGPFKFVEFKPNESIKVARNPDYWKPGRPYLDAIEYTIIKNPSTWVLAVGAQQFDRTPLGIMSIPIMKELQKQAPQIQCETVPWNISRHMIVNRAAAPFDKPELRHAMSLTLDRRAFIDIISDGQGEIGGAMMPPPAGVWGVPAEMLATFPGYNPDVSKNRAAARELMKKLGYGPDKRLAVTVTTRNVPAYRDATVLLIDQLKEIFIDGTLNAIDTTQWYPTVMRKDYTVGLTVAENGLDDPDQQYYENYACGSDRNYTGYCNKEVDELVDRQSREANFDKRKTLVWEIERKLIEDDARPSIFYPRSGICRYPWMKGQVAMVNGNYNGWRMEDVWLDR